MLKKAKRQAALDGLRDYLSELADQRARTDGEIETVRKTIAMLEGSQTTAVSTGETPHQGPPRGAGPQDVVIAFLRANPGKIFKSSVVAKMILQSGYRPNHPKTWQSQVRNILIRTVGKGIAIEGEIDGRKAFGLKPEGDIK